MAYEDVPVQVPEEIIALIEKYYPEGTAIAIVSEHLDGSAAVSIAGIYPTDTQIIATIRKGIDSWTSEP